MIKRELKKQKTLSVNLANDEQRKAEVAFLLDFLKTNKNDILKKSIDLLDSHQTSYLINTNLNSHSQKYRPEIFYQKIIDKAKGTKKDNLYQLSNPILTIKLNKHTMTAFQHIQCLNKCHYADKRKTNKIEYSISELLKLAIDDLYLFCTSQASPKQALTKLQDNNQLTIYFNKKFNEINP